MRICWIARFHSEKCNIPVFWKNLQLGFPFSSGHSVLAGQSPHHRWRYTVWAVTENWTSAPCLKIWPCPGSGKFSWKRGQIELCMPCLPQYHEDGAWRPKQVSFVHGRRNITGFCLQWGKPASCLRSKTDASDLGGKVKRMIFGKVGGAFCRKRMYYGSCGSHFNDTGKRVNFKLCPKFCSNLGMRIPGQGLWWFSGTSLGWAHLPTFSWDFTASVTFPLLQASRKAQASCVGMGWHQQLPSTACAWISAHGRITACSETALSVFR